VTGLSKSSPPAVSPDGKRYAARVGKEIRVGEIGAEKAVVVIEGLPATATPAAFGPGGKLLLLHDLEGGYVVHDVEKGVTRGRVKSANGRVFAPAGFSPPAFTTDGKRFALHASPGTVEVWNAGEVARHKVLISPSRKGTSNFFSENRLAFLDG